MATLLPLVDKALGGTLHQRLAEYRRRNTSYADISHLLREDGIAVSHETIRKWCFELGVENRTEPTEAAS